MNHESDLMDIIKDSIFEEKSRQREYINELKNQIEYINELKSQIEYFKGEISHKNIIITSLISKISNPICHVETRTTKRNGQDNSEKW